MAMACTKETVKPSGLNIWSSEAADGHTPAVDIIAVQGLGSHEFYTWVKKVPSADADKSKRFRDMAQFWKGNKQERNDGEDSLTEVMWLRDLLVPMFKDARIATYSYKSDWRDRAVRTSLRQCAEQFLNILSQHRQRADQRKRPLVLIGHSLGSLVIQQALVIAIHQREFTNLRLSVAGVIFLGAPFQGSDVASVGTRLAQLSGLDSTILQLLEKDSPSLYALSRDFWGSHSDWDLVCFYEMVEAEYGPIKKQMVSSQSASLVGKRMMFLNTDHSGLNKFSGKDDENFELVLPEIRRMVEDGPSIVAERHCTKAAIIEMSSSQSTQYWDGQQSGNSMVVLPVEENVSRGMNSNQISYGNMTMDGYSKTHAGTHNQQTHNGDTITGPKITHNYFYYGTPSPRPYQRPLHMSPRLDEPNRIIGDLSADSPHTRIPSQEWSRRESPFERLPFIERIGTDEEMELIQQHGIAQAMEVGFDAIEQKQPHVALDYFLQAGDTLQLIPGENLGLKLRLHNGLQKAEMQLTYLKSSDDEKTRHFNQSQEYNKIALDIARRSENHIGYLKARLVKAGMMTRLMKLRFDGGSLTGNAEASLRELAEKEISSVMAEACSLESGPDREWVLDKAVVWRSKFAALEFER